MTDHLQCNYLNIVCKTWSKHTYNVYTPAANKFVLCSGDKFIQEYPTVELLGQTSMVAVHGKAHTRVRSFVINAINRSEALRHTAALVQPSMVTALHSWAQMGKIKAQFETQKVSIECAFWLFYVELI